MNKLVGTQHAPEGELIPLVRVEELTKLFPGVQALGGVTLSLMAGEVHGLVGENGAGKSTLMKILSGVYQPTSGRVLIQGREVALRGPSEAQRHGIAMIHQELNLVEELSVADNIFLGREHVRRGLIDRKATNARAVELLKALDCPLEPERKVRTLSLAQKQMVEIAKALSTDARVLIMDEPTAVLTQRETRALLALIQRLKQQGVAIVYISHLLPEVLQVCDRITVLRDGRAVASVDGPRIKTLGERELASMMVGRPMSEHFPPRQPHGSQVRLAVRGLSVPGLVHDVSFEVRQGEILGFAGLIGAGRTELAEAIMGLRPRRGELLIDGVPLSIRDVREAATAGLAYVSEDRKGTGLVLGMGVAENTTLVSLRKYCRTPLSLIDLPAEDQATRGHIEKLRIKVASSRRAVETLSGGNQQKVALAKWLEMAPKVLIVDEPTRGVDIGAKEEIYRLLQALAAQGMACIMISSEMNELLGMCHRIAVLHKGRLVATQDGATATEEALMHAAAGVA
ncbi:sugar ABC transporter ATP-binding protein [Archangium minus]|uniref:Sugar ABC transporter ATP-binding protein n=1 Tax=Archangium minus TaxID=83450 RepID=A0ABY9X9I5_9BACT|nr:sugar ABC transporter ATP-binding protein [Archangium minus]